MIVDLKTISQGETSMNLAAWNKHLGEENVNVSFMSVGRIAPRKQAVMAIGVDEQPSKESLKKIGDIPAVEEFVFLKL